ncbi:TonB-dependent receptor [Rufibacter roseus]|uniref:TonB-dependent receptor domain-containing protein n=1 Tax=Rufibacter roseus TaxID=1567108 RepID=A0ABW2DK65_9BACT|nr:TonB-dependent receptor [Rufibacter roseus]
MEVLSPRHFTQFTISFQIRIFFFICLLLALPFAGQAQKKEAISGKVIDTGSNAIEFANVYLKGTEAATQTKADGTFTLSAPSGDYELVISFVGYSTKTTPIQIAAGRTTNLGTIVLSENQKISEVVVTGKTQGTIVKEEGFNVTVLDAKKLYSTSADLNQALNRTTGIRVREDGGVGSNFSFSLNGFTGRQVKFFLDGIPMDNFGSSLTLNNLPVTMAERVEVYKGVLPIHLGADALGGAVNIVTRANPNFLDFSYGLGSFNTHKASVNGAFTNPDNGLTFRANAFYNYSDNNYKVEVQPINFSTGQREEAREVERFHDKYKSGTLQLEGGVSGKKYADLLLVGVIASGNEKDIQTGVTMEQVFGARTSRSSSVIPTVKYRKTNLLVEGLDLSLYSAYNMTQFRLIDTTRAQYNWLQETKPTSTAEQNRTQLKNKDNEGLTTANLSYAINPVHSLSFNYVFSDFERKSSDVEDPENVTYQFPQSLKKQVMGFAWQMNKHRFNATAFSKLYLLDASSFERVLDGTGTGYYAPTQTNTNNVGYGLAAAGFILPQFQLKASYEHTYRLPEAIELLGDGLYYRGNPDLVPENSDNINVGVNYSFKIRTDHQIAVEANYIYRKSGNYIRPDQRQTQPIDRQYINVGNVNTNGAETDFRYSWKNKFQLGLNLTYQNIIDKQESFTSTNETGTTVYRNWGYDHRLPNTPYLFGNAEVGYSFTDLGTKDNVLTFNYSLNYVEEYYFTPHHLGSNNQDVIPRQLAHNAMINYTQQNGKYGLSLECRNLTDNKLFDNFKLQKPGRSFFLRVRYFINK